LRVAAQMADDPFSMRRFVSIVAVLLCACDDSPPPEPPTPVVPVCTSPAAQPAPLRRLTRAEYDATVRDLLGDDSHPARTFPPDEESQGFDNFAETQSVSPLLAEGYLSAAEALAASADPIALAGCDPSDEGVCLQKLLAGFGRRAFRRPLSADEAQRMTAVFADVRAEEDAPTAMRAVVAVLLQSPQFLYRFESAPLTNLELASRLSYFLWGSAPDDVLLDAAEEGPLDLKAQGQRMLADPRARGVVQRFHLQWLGVAGLPGKTKDPQQFPTFAGLAALMQEETARMAEWTVFDGNGDARRLFDGHTTFLNEPLAEHYGLTGFQGSGFVKADTDRTARIGVLTQGSVLSAWSKHDQTSPVLRGKLVRERFLCQSPKPPPGNVIAMLGTPDAGTTRQRLAAHVTDVQCSGCHQLMDPIGFGLEKYDAVGAYRTHENEIKVDATGELIAAGDLEGTFDGALELSSRLANSRDVKKCLAVQWFRFAFGRTETAGDACSIAEAQKAFETSGWNTRELLIALTQTEAFRRSVR
jgi:hypothetical protein